MGNPDNSKRQRDSNSSDGSYSRNESKRRDDKVTPNRESSSYTSVASSGLNKRDDNMEVSDDEDGEFTVDFNKALEEVTEAPSNLMLEGRMRYPNELFIYKGEEGLDLFEDHEWDVLCEQLDKLVMDEILERAANGKRMISNDGFFLQDGIGRALCSNLMTSEWLKGAIEGIKIDEEGTKLKAWNRAERGAVIKIRFYAPNLIKTELKKLTRVLQAQNSLPGVFKVVELRDATSARKTGGRKGGSTIIALANRPAVEKIQADGGRIKVLQYGISKVRACMGVNRFKQTDKR